MPKIKKEKKNTGIVLSKENLLIQPLALTLMGINPTVIGNRVNIAIVRRLQKAFKQMIQGRKSGKEWNQLSIFATDEVKEKYLGENKLVFDLHMNELVDEPQHYQDAFNAVCQFADVKVLVPITEKGKVTLVRLSIFTLMLSEDVDCKNIEGTTKKIYRYKKNTNPIIGIAVERVVAEYIFGFQKKYSDYLDYPAIESNEKYFPPLYIYLSAHKYADGGILEVEYKELRRILGLEYEDGEEWRYPAFYQFNKRILTPCMENLREMADRGEADCFFDFEKIYLGKRAMNPDKIRFHIYLSELGKSIKAEKVSTKAMMEIEERLHKEFDQTKSQVRSILKAVPLGQRMELTRKMDQLSADRAAGKIKIESSWRAYCNVAFSALIDEIKQSAASATLQFAGYADDAQGRVGASAPAAQVPAPDASPVAGASDYPEEEVALWEKYISRLKELVPENVSNIYVKELSYGGREDEKVFMVVPNSAFWEIFLQQCKGAETVAFREVYGSEMRLRGKIKRKF